MILLKVGFCSDSYALKRSFTGRLLFERIPEQTTTINDGTGTFWSSKYTYADWGAVATKQDARGVITTYGYDTLHRLVTITYNTVSGVTTAPAVSYNYDNTGGSATKGLLLSLSVGSGYSETYNYNVGVGNGGNGGNKLTLASVTRVIDGRSYQTSYQYNSANQLTQMTYPSGRVIALGHDNKGRITSVGSFLSSVTYNGIGQMTGTTLGNGVTESYGYDANRMQLTSQLATQSGGPTGGLMNLTYGYQAAAGQMGAGSTAGNAGQLMSVSGTIGGVTESTAYTYDNLGRLVTSNQTSNTVSAQRRFAYDHWGNRTGTWDAVSGGNQIQSITLQQSGGAPTNQIASVTSGSTVNYVYDAAGNVTNDGAHTYAYDSENRIVSVDGGSTATNAYDQSNQRYKKVTGGATTHYIWQSSQVIAEHNGSTGAVLIDYVYSGSRMIAKVASGTAQYFLSDRLSTRLVLDTTGNVLGRQGHFPFGGDFGESGTQEKHHFTSYERDGESLTDYAVNRQYSSIVGRFMRVDPHRSRCSQTNPQGSNRYAYAQNDSTNRSDPLGLKWILIGCTHYTDGFGGECTQCTGYDDGQDGAITVRIVCDGPVWTNGSQEPFVIVQNPLGGQTGGAPPMSCGECCALGLDICKEQFFSDMARLNSAAAAQQCIAECMRSGPGFGRCLLACMSREAIGNLKKTKRYVDDFNQCLAGQSNLCADEREGCWCPWM